ncbi:MAG: ribosome maturation factor RimM [Alphaproteobacteria bacterium]|nr:ribosome maturation factor RimM [Alphaproteobacteria bacterium]
MAGPGDDRRDRVVVGVVGRAHGVRGQVHIRSYTARPEDIVAYGPVETADGRRLEIAVVAVNKTDVTARISGVTDRNGAEALRGQELFVVRAALPETAADEYYHHDLVGLRAESVAGKALGRVTAVEDFGAGPVLELERVDGRGVYMPFTADAVVKVDVAAGRITLDPPPGLLDDDGNEDGRQDRSDER